MELKVCSWMLDMIKVRQFFLSLKILWEKLSKNVQRWEWWRAHMQYSNKRFYVYLINAKVRHDLYIISKDSQYYNRENFHRPETYPISLYFKALDPLPKKSDLFFGGGSVSSDIFFNSGDTVLIQNMKNITSKFLIDL